MIQEERSERSRGAILKAALELFSRQGYRATSIRDIAAKADVSTGSVYHHFSDKEELFETLLRQFRTMVESPEFPLYKVVERGAFPDRLEEIGRVCREIIAEHRSTIALIYVDVVEFEGLHIREFYQGMATLCERFIADHKHELPIVERLRAGVPPAAAMLMTFRIFLYYFVLELLFGVPNHFGLSSDEAIGVISDILQHGMLKRT
ncbi:MAG TPA: helix-turn-helix domain-containing protein [Vicinamibacterales bacterium]|nr:helix-turn-helix domain-containing protein [Vicinamibacterales bacterium]